MIIYKVLFGLVLIKGKCLQGSAPGMISIPVWKLKTPKLALISNAWFPVLSCQDFCTASMLAVSERCQYLHAYPAFIFYL